MLLETELRKFLETVYNEEIDTIDTNMFQVTKKEMKATENDLQLLWDDAIMHYEFLQNNQFNMNEQIPILQAFISRMEKLDMDTNPIKELFQGEINIMKIISSICHTIVD